MQSYTIFISVSFCYFLFENDSVLFGFFVLKQLTSVFAVSSEKKIPNDHGPYGSISANINTFLRDPITFISDRTVYTY